MGGTWVKRRSSLVLIGFLHLVANAADLIPDHLSGTWGTAASLYDGTDKQNEMYFLPDGFGLAAGSTAPLRRADGVDDGKPAPRAIIGFPFRATLNAETIIIHPFLPKRERPLKVGDWDYSCRYAAAGPTLTCIGPEGPAIVMFRRNDSVPDEIVRVIDSVR